MPSIPGTAWRRGPRAASRKIAEAVPRAGAFVTHDELLELSVHSRLWAVLHAACGWDVAQTYRATSCLAGGAAALLALGLARRYPPARRLLVVSGVFARGRVLVFFGDVENYTVTNVLVLAYLATEPRLRTRAPWITVMVVLAATHTAAWIAENHTPVTG